MSFSRRNGYHIANSNSLRAYTMVEVMIVLLLLVVLVTMLLPIFQTSKDTAKMAVCTINLKQIYNGLMTQSVQEQEVFMANVDPYLWEVYAEELVESQVMVCPMETDGNHFKESDLYQFLPTPPPDMDQGTKESDSKVFVFREQVGFELKTNQEVVDVPRRYGKGGAVCDYDITGSIPAGTVVDIYYFSYDPTTKNNQGQEGEIWFDGNSTVLGFLGKTAHLNETDLTVGIPDYKYFTGNCRGLSKCGGKLADSVELTSHRRSIIHQLSKANLKCKDDFRVFTDSGSGSSYGLNFESVISNAAEEQILLADAKIPWINFREGRADHDEYTFEETIDARHFGKVNAVTRNGSVQLIPVEDLTPDSKFWRS